MLAWLASSHIRSTSREHSWPSATRLARQFAFIIPPCFLELISITAVVMATPYTSCEARLAVAVAMRTISINYRYSRFTLQCIMLREIYFTKYLRNTFSHIRITYPNNTHLDSLSVLVYIILKGNYLYLLNMKIS